MINGMTGWIVFMETFTKGLWAAVSPKNLTPSMASAVFCMRKGLPPAFVVVDRESMLLRPTSLPFLYNVLS